MYTHGAVGGSTVVGMKINEIAGNYVKSVDLFNSMSCAHNFKNYLARRLILGIYFSCCFLDESLNALLKKFVESNLTMFSVYAIKNWIRI